MQYFLKLCELIKDNKLHTASKYNDLPSTPNIINWIENNQPIVFSSNETENNNLIIESYKFNSEKIELDAPFKYFSIELINKPIANHIDQDKNRNLLIYCILCQEIKPKEFIYLILFFEPTSTYWGVLPSTNEGQIIKKYLHILNTQKIGIKSSRSAIKLGTGKEKRLHRIKKIIYCCNKSDFSQFSQSEKSIDWSHRWLVRGHWRHIEQTRLGKDREGNYSVQGFTWVKEHEKGPEGLPVIKKTRVIYNDKNA